MVFCVSHSLIRLERFGVLSIEGPPNILRGVSFHTIRGTSQGVAKANGSWKENANIFVTFGKRAKKTAIYFTRPRFHCSQ